MTNPLEKRACFYPENETIDWWLRLLAHPYGDTPIWKMSIGTASKARAIIEVVPAEQERLAEEFERLHEGRIVIQIGAYCPSWRRTRTTLAFTPRELELFLNISSEHAETHDGLWARVCKHLLEQCCEAVQRELRLDRVADQQRGPCD